MAEFFEVFATEDAIVVHEQFLDLLAELLAIQRVAAARRIPSPVSAVLPRVERAYLDFKAELDAVAKATARDFDVRARAFLAATTRRDDTRAAPHLRNLILSRPATIGAFPIGAVGLARISSLERARNPHTPGYGSYWRAQEFGTGTGEVKTQIGRRFVGYFFRPGLRAPERPQMKYRGNGDPAYPIFVPGRASNLPSSVKGGIGPRGGRGGKGEIHHEIAPRRFLRNAADATYRDYLGGIKSVQARALQDLAGL